MYDSVEAFSRAFKKEYKTSPRDFRKYFTEVELIKKLSLSDKKRKPKNFIIPKVKFVLKREPELTEYIVIDMTDRDDIDRVKYYLDYFLLDEYGLKRRNNNYFFNNDKRNLFIPIIKINKNKSELMDLLSIKIENIQLTSRSYNCLVKAKFKTLGDIVSKKEDEILLFDGFSKNHLNALKVFLKNDYGLSLGMDVEKLKKGENR